jgi:hypothetical protein
MRRLQTILLALACTGCTTAVPVVPPAPRCELSPALLAACDGPGGVKPDITFGELIDIAARDRESLRACALRHQALADAVSVCKTQIQAFDTELEKINARRNAKR